MMAFRVGLVFLVMAMFLAVATAFHHDGVRIGMPVEADGHGLVSDALEDEELMETEIARRQMRAARQNGGYISYGALSRNNVPCNRPGQSYYNCRANQRANPYDRGCTRATKCARNNR